MPVIPFIPAIIAAAGTTAAVAVQANAANKAAKVQERAGTDALNLQRDVLGQQQQNTEPFRQAGVASLGRLNTMLGGPNEPQPGIGRDMPPGMLGGDLILVTAPNGETQQRPAAQADHWQRLGATVRGVGGSAGVKAMARPQQAMSSLSALAARGRVR